MNDETFKRLAIVTSAYTGVLVTQSFGDVHAYIEEVLGRPVWTHELPSIVDEIREAAKPELFRLWGLN